MIPGDGIGKEMTSAVKTLFKAVNCPIEWEQVNVSFDSENYKEEVVEAIKSLKRNKVGLKGVLFTPILRTGSPSLNVTIRKELDLFASMTLCVTPVGYQLRHQNVDIVVIRENTEGEYSGLEHESYPGVVESLKVITRANSERIARFAFDYCVMHNRKKVTVVHKANIMKLADGLFLETCTEIASLYPKIQFESMIVDNTAMQLVSKPQQFDVMLMPNLYGNIVSNIAAGLTGGAGMAPGANIGYDIALFEPGARHVARDIQGKNVANPTAMIQSGILLLRHLGLFDHAQLIQNALSRTLIEKDIKTKDMGGNATTTDFTLAVVNMMMNGDDIIAF
jgi:isocitrate dehydrogenase (NAD+)